MRSWIRIAAIVLNFAAPTVWAAPKGVVALIPGTLNSALPGNIHENPIGQKWEISPYFSIDIVHAFEAQGFAVHVVKDLGMTSSFESNGQAVARELSAWYWKNFPAGDVPITLVGHSCGGIYGLYALSHSPGLPIRNLFFVSTPLNGSELADTAFSSGAVGVYLQTFVEKTAGLFDLRGLLEASTQRVRSFVDSQPVNREVLLYSVTGRQSTTLNPFQAFNSEFINPMLVPTYAWINRVAGENDGVVSIRSSSGVDIYFRGLQGERMSIIHLPSLTMNLDHMEQMLDARLFAPGGIQHLESIRAEQVRVYTGIAKIAAQ